MKDRDVAHTLETVAGFWMYGQLRFSWLLFREIFRQVHWTESSSALNENKVHYYRNWSSFFLRNTSQFSKHVAISWERSMGRTAELKTWRTEIKNEVTWTVENSLCKWIRHNAGRFRNTWWLEIGAPPSRAQYFNNNFSLMKHFEKGAACYSGHYV